MIDYEAIAKQSKLIGKAQLVIIFMLSYAMIFQGFQTFIPVFISYSPSYRCNVAPLSDYIKNETILLNYTTPLVNGEYDGCKRYNYNISECNTTSLSCVDKTAPTIKCDQGYVYDDSIFTETIVTKFDLVCDRSNLKSFSTSAYELGSLIGSTVFGNLADKIGRKRTSIFTIICALTCSFLTSQCNTIASYMVVRFLTAFFIIGLIISTMTYATEVTESKHRTKVMVYYQCMFGLACLIESAVAYKIRNWDDLLLIANIISAPYLLFSFIIPESPRWLFAQNKNKQGKQVIRKMAFLNKKSCDESLWENKIITNDVTETENKKQKHSTIELFTNPKLRIITLKIIFCCCATSLVYYGISLNTARLAGNLFLNNGINAIVEIASIVLGGILVDSIGRRPTISGGLFVGSIGNIVSLLIVELVDQKSKFQVVGVVFAFIGKFGISATYNFIFLYSSEIYPSVIRSTGMGMMSFAIRIGSISAPFIIMLQTSVSWLPGAVYTVLGFAAVFVSLLFPETRHIDSMETIEEAEYFYEHKVQLKNTINRKEGKKNKVFSIA